MNISVKLRIYFRSIIHFSRKTILNSLLQLVMAMPDEDPQKIKEIRRFSAIYGRFDAKRKPEKPLTLHEVR